MCDYRKYLVGTALVIGGGILALCLTALGYPKPISLIISIPIMVVGFGIQLRALFRMRASLEKLDMQFKALHDALTAELARLKPSCD